MEQTSTKRKISEISQSTWIKHWSEKHNKHYWQNTQTGETTWEDKSNLPPVPTVKWTKQRSRKYDRDYWVNEETGQSVWEEPAELRAQRESDAAPVHAMPNYEAMIEQERVAVAYNAPTCPREVDSFDIPSLVARLRSECAVVITDKLKVGEHKAVFSLPDEDTSHITRFMHISRFNSNDINNYLAGFIRAFQEDQILGVRLKLKQRGEVIDLKSFWEIWESNPEFRQRIISSRDPHEEKWKCMREFKYKIATTFMPGYAKAIFDFFKAEVVMDPCSGWGDRLLGAEASSYVKKYIGFDPNMTLRPGYARTMKACGHGIESMTRNHLRFSNSFEIHSYPFEIGSLSIPSDSVDLVFTSPPFFDYEMYNPNNPQYRDWISDFYDPFVVHACRCVKPGNYVGIYIGDTSAGNIEDFIRTRVHTICPMDLVFSIGFVGIMSDKVRGVWIFKKKNVPQSAFSDQGCDLARQFPMYARAIADARARQQPTALR